MFNLVGPFMTRSQHPLPSLDLTSPPSNCVARHHCAFDLLTEPVKTSKHLMLLNGYKILRAAGLAAILRSRLHDHSDTPLRTLALTFVIRAKWINFLGVAL
jgi:hypothetical protein